jgi:hypothetical protein
MKDVQDVYQPVQAKKADSPLAGWSVQHDVWHGAVACHHQS